MRIKMSISCHRAEGKKIYAHLMLFAGPRRTDPLPLLLARAVLKCFAFRKNIFQIKRTR